MSGYIVYILFAILLIATSVVEYFFKTNRLVKLIMFSILITVFFVLAIFKGPNVGSDSVGYSEWYSICQSGRYSLKEWLSKHPIEYLYFSAMYISAFYIKLPEIAFICATYVIICAGIFLSFFKDEKPCFHLAMLFFVGFLSMSFSGIRQSIAIIYGIYAMRRFLLKENVKKTDYIFYFVIVALCATIHKSSIVLVIVPFVLLLRKIDLDYLVIFLPLLIFLPSLFGGIYFYMYQMLSLTYSPLTHRVSITFILTLLLLIVFYLIIFNKKVNNFLEEKNVLSVEQNENDSKYYLLLVFSSLFLSMNQISTVIPRISMYFYFVFSYLFLRIINSLKNKYFRIGSLLLCLLVFAVYFLYSLPNLSLVPYEFR